MLINKLSYKKKDPYRDAKLYIIVCEGEKREYDYFNFFNGISSKLKVHTYSPVDGYSSPNHVINNAKIHSEKYDLTNDDEVWIIVDVDSHKDLIHDVVKEVKDRNWFIAISNPCFEVWLFYHFKDNLPEKVPTNCLSWKKIVHNVVNGGFDSLRHPTFINRAIENSKRNYSKDGYMPKLGSTSIFNLGKKIYEQTENVINEYLRKETMDT